MINTISSLIIYYILICFGIYYNIAIFIGYIGSSVIGYILNKFWVFQRKEDSLKNSIVKYYIIYGSALLLNLFFMNLWVELLNISEKIAPILTLCITVPYNFIWSKLWVFKEKKERE